MDEKTEQDVSAEEADTPKTDEQLWDEITAEKPDEPDAPDEDPEPQGEDEAASADDDDTPDTSEGEDEKTAGDAKTSDPQDLQAELEKLRQRDRSRQGRLKHQTKEIERLQTELARLRDKPAVSDDARQAIRDKLESARSDYGDVVEPLADAISHLEARLDAQDDMTRREAEALEGHLSSLKDQQTEEWKQNHRKVVAAHPDFATVLQTQGKAFVEWVENQDRATRDAFARNEKHIEDPEDAIYLMSAFKAHLSGAARGGSEPHSETRPTRRERQLQGNRPVPSASRRTVADAAPPDGASEREHWEYFEKLERQKKA